MSTPPVIPDPAHQEQVPPGQPPVDPPHTGISRWAAALLAVITLGMLTGAGLNLVTFDQVAYRPGPMYDTLGTIGDNQVIEVDSELETFPTEGQLYFTTIRFSGGPGDTLTAWEWLSARFDDSITLVPREQVFPDDVTAEQVREQNTSLMQHSQEDAAVVALRAMGEQIPEDIVVAQVIVDAPADGVLFVEDEILSVEGEEMSDTEAVRARLQDVPAGQSASMTILRDGEEMTIDVPTRLDEESGRTIVGVYLAPRYTLPHDVTITAGNVGGPSAGLMFSLAIYDVLTPGALTGGKAIAGTGALTGTGLVQPIGGIIQKMHAANNRGVDLFLAPKANCEEAAENIPSGLLVVPVETFDEAKDVIEQVVQAEDPESLELPTCTTG